MPLDLDTTTWPGTLRATNLIGSANGFDGPSMKRGRALGMPILSDFATPASDHTAALQDMMTYCRTFGVKGALVDDGTWTIDEKIVLNVSNFRFTGSGPGSILQIGPGMPDQAALLETVSGVSGVEVAHLRIKGIGNTNTHPFGVHGWPNSYHMLVHHLICEDLGYYGGVDFSQCNRSIVHSCIAVRCYRGFTSSGDTNNYGTTIAQCIAEDCRQGISVEAGRGVRVVNNYVASHTAGLYGIDNSGCDGAYFAGNEVYRTLGGTFYPFITGRGNLSRVTSTHARRNKILGNTFRGGTGGMYLQMLEDSIVAHNTVDGMSSWAVTLGSTRAIGVSRHNRFSGNILSGPLGISEVRGSDNRFHDNDLAKVTGARFSALDASSRTRANDGYVTENSGSAVVPGGSTSVVVAHGLAGSPGHNVAVTPTSSMGDAGKFWVGDVGATSFTIHVDADPGAAEASFAWEARKFV